MAITSPLLRIGGRNGNLPESQVENLIKKSGLGITCREPVLHNNGRDRCHGDERERCRGGVIVQAECVGDMGLLAYNLWYQARKQYRGEGERDNPTPLVTQLEITSMPGKKEETK
ncbi:hypothetical protein CDAR_275051 [Caerostris darwini]|uniref:Uncharacterized protein n=1 Tax=Caerostris darwini TaxID=1538125 RepID=A0AAV4PEG7_9ARAC|nr:hypothetical protein CDAR_275051 [Caerostris darwini]